MPENYGTSPRLFWEKGKSIKILPSYCVDKG